MYASIHGIFSNANTCIFDNLGRPISHTKFHISFAYPYLCSSFKSPIASRISSRKTFVCQTYPYSDGISSSFAIVSGCTTHNSFKDPSSVFLNIESKEIHAISMSMQRLVLHNCCLQHLIQHLRLDPLRHLLRNPHTK